MNEAYHDKILSITDSNKRAEALQPILDFAENLESVGETVERTLKSVVATMQSAKDQFTELVRLNFTSVYLSSFSATGIGLSQSCRNRSRWRHCIHWDGCCSPTNIVDIWRFRHNNGVG
jgi:hypothetical protein